MLSPKEFQELYMSVYEGMDPEERALKRELAADKRASKMDAKVGSKYAGSEARSAERADKKSKGKHIHGMADSYEMEGDIVDEAKKPSQITKMQKLKDLMSQRHKDNEKARKEMMGTQSHKDMVKAASKHFEEVEIDEESYMDYAKRKQAEKKDSRKKQHRMRDLRICKAIEPASKRAKAKDVIEKCLSNSS